MCVGRQAHSSIRVIACGYLRFHAAHFSRVNKDGAVFERWNIVLKGVPRENHKRKRRYGVERRVCLPSPF